MCILYNPRTMEAQKALSKRVADVHAQAVADRIKTLSCPQTQKKKLMDTIIRQYQSPAKA